jgi:Tfp pilus assembly pilus retraction ATPase PilT
MTSDCTKPGICLRNLLTTMLIQKASDLHVIPGIPPHVRIQGEIHQLDYQRGTLALAIRSIPFQIPRFEEPLFSLYQSNLISEERALGKSSRPDELIQMMRNHDH